MKSRYWIICWGVIVAICLGIVAIMTYRVDPYFHYHKPDTNRYFYELDNERSQNDGISRHFDYDAIIIGSSMCENFKTTQMDQFFGTKSIKLPYPGATLYELGQSIDRALGYNDKVRIVVSGIDMVRFDDASTAMRTDLGVFPFYLYDNNSFNDIEYLLNRDVFFEKILVMERDRTKEAFSPGVTSFDDYSSWVRSSGINSVRPNGVSVDKDQKQKEPKASIEEIVTENITRNITDIADKHPDVEFYYFLTPYSIVWWGDNINDGYLYRQLDKERCVIELLLQHDNIKLFSFNGRTDITTDINNYSDERHYGFWINSLMLKWMSEGKYQLTEDNYMEYLAETQKFYESFDYDSLNFQEDYRNDYMAAALNRRELTGIEPLLIEDNMSNGDSIIIEDADDYEYLVYYDSKVSEGDLATVVLYDEADNVILSNELEDSEIGAGPRLHVIKFEDRNGSIRLEFGNGFGAGYVFSEIGLY